ncbi:MAG: arginine--tRNA ligase [Parvibaculaceae bacterium]
MNLFAHFDAVVREALGRLVAAGKLPDGLDRSRIAVEPPRDPSHGDVTTNAAMVLAKAAKTAPRAIAEALAAELAKNEDVVGAEIAGAGFVNLRLKDEVWQRIVRSALSEGEAYGRSELGRGRKVNVEYVSANPTGPMHVGHCRGAVFGDALANLLATTGHAVTREYYINDAGVQVDVLARSVYLRYREALGEDIGKIPEGLYPGDYLKPVGRALADLHGDALLGRPEHEWLPIVRAAAVAEMLAVIRGDLSALNIHHETFFSEASLHGQGGPIDLTLEALRARGHVYQGTLPPPKGQPSEDWEDREQTLFRTSDWGDDSDRPLVKSDGSYTYFASDVAYMRDKIGRGFEDLIFVLGADHSGYVRRLEAVAAALSDGKARVDVKLVQLVRLFRAGVPVKMSKRAGEFVTLRDVVDEVGSDVVRFMMLTRKNDAPLDFDFQKVTEQSRDNPVFYVQYAHARICSVFRNANIEIPGQALDEATLSSADLSPLQDPAELALMRRVAAFPRLLEQASEAHEPHRIAFYLYDLASDFHVLWNRGKELPHLRFISRDHIRDTVARLALLRAIRYVLANGLAILGVRPVAEM